jgi:hypothetical protein
MVETNVFNWLAQGDLSIDDLPSNGDFVATPVQRAELEAACDDAKRGALPAKFSEVVTCLYSAPFAFDVPGAGFDQGRWTDGILASARVSRCYCGGGALGQTGLASSIRQIGPSS